MFEHIMPEPIESSMQLLQLLGSVYKVLTRATVRRSGHLPSIKTQVHRFHTTESVPYIEQQPTSSIEPLSDVVNGVEIRQSFIISDSPFRRQGEIALLRNCIFVGIENIYGERLSRCKYQVKETKSPDCPSKISIDTKQLQEKQAWISGNRTIYIVSSTDDQAIVDYYLTTERLYNGDFVVRPAIDDAGKGRCLYIGGTLYDPCFRETRYGCYCNLDEGDRSRSHSLVCAMDIIETMYIYRIDDSLLQTSRCGRVYGLGQLVSASREGIILTETDRARERLPKLDLKRL
jgi:hypothetical protein